jgi:hypothetical protein
MRPKFIILLLLLFSLAPCTCSLALAGEKKTLSTPVRLCVYWVTPSGPNAAFKGWQHNSGHGLSDAVERKGYDGEKKKERTLRNLHFF